MATLVSSLPGDKSSAFMYVYDNRNSLDGNLMTRIQVQAAKEKGWKVYKYDESAEQWVEYAGDIVYADANGDGEVTVEDVKAVCAYILGLEPTPFEVESADVSNDGDVNIEDVTRLIELVKAPL